MAQEVRVRPCIVGALTEYWPFVFAVKVNQTDAW